ncbi:MAG: hypothetical protein R3E58_00055 [Phycisphaerae bacterium]
MNAFANTIAHETGHTLGFFHPDPDAVDRLLLTPSSEIMRANTTTEELLSHRRSCLTRTPARAVLVLAIRRTA